MEYRITTSAIPPQCENKEEYYGLLMHIRPPIQLNPNAVESYLTYEDFEHVDKTYSLDGLNVKDVTVLGSTSEQTTIYASIQKYPDEQTAEGVPDKEIIERVTRDIAKLLTFMGSQALVE